MIQQATRQPQIEVTRMNPNHVEVVVEVGLSYKIRAHGPASELDAMTEHVARLLQEIRRQRP